MTKEEAVQKAIECYASEDVQIDDVTSDADGGLWVRAWVWIPEPERMDYDEARNDADVY